MIHGTVKLLLLSGLGYLLWICDKHSIYQSMLLSISNINFDSKVISQHRLLSFGNITLKPEDLILGTIGCLLFAGLGYLLWICAKLGFFQRLPLSFSNIELELELDKAAKRHGNKPIISLQSPLPWLVPGKQELSADGTTWSAIKMRNTVAHLAHSIHGVGIKQYQRVAIFKQNRFDILLFSLAVFRAGGIGVPINGCLDSDKIGPYLNYTGSDVMFTDTATLSRVLLEHGNFGKVSTIILAEQKTLASLNILKRFDSLFSKNGGVCFHWIEDLLSKGESNFEPVIRDAHDPLLITHTSGTTGFPKGVVLTKRGLSHSMRLTLMFNLISRKDKAYITLPFNHQVTHLYIHSCLALGVPVYFSNSIEPKDILQTLAAERYTAFFGFPIAYTQICNLPMDEYDLSAMRVWGTTADASHEVHQRACVKHGSFFKRLGIPITGSIFVDGLGSSEVGIAALLRIITSRTKYYERRVGVTIPFGPKVKVLNKQGKLVKQNEPGRLYIKGPCMFGGYWDEHSKLYNSTVDGWWCTGDIVRRTTDGQFSHLDREVDVIHRHNGVLYSLLIEDILHKHEAVYDLCVFGLPSSGNYQLPVVAVAVKEGFDGCNENQLLKDFNEMLSPGQHLERVFKLAWKEFPIGVTGKTLKRVFRDKYQSVIESEYPPAISQNRKG